MSTHVIQTRPDAPELSQVRELLFGQQFRAIHEELSTRDQAARDAWQRDADAVRARLEAAVEDLESKLADANRAIENLEQRIDKRLVKSVGMLEGMLSRDRDAHQLALARVQDVVLARIDALGERLEGDKVSRQSMADLLKVMAGQLFADEPAEPVREGRDAKAHRASRKASGKA